jgi:UDP-galactopyranose mutase
MTSDVLVVGSGLAGATAARLMADKGKSVTVIEKRDHIGGNCFDYKNEADIFVHKYGPHIFHTNNKEVWDFANRFADFNTYSHKVLSYIEGEFVPFPINKETINKVFNVDIKVDEVKDFLKSEVEKSKFNNPPLNFEDAVISKCGERMYELFFKNYTAKQWDRDPKELMPEMANRIPVREDEEDRYFTDAYQGIPEEGYTKLIENMLSHENIKIVTGSDYFSIKDKVNCDLVVYTGKLDEFFDYSFGELQYRSVFFEFKDFDMEYYQPASVINYPNDNAYTRITEFKYFKDNNKNNTTICLEYPTEKGEPSYILMSEENKNKREQYMEKVKELEEQGRFVFLGRLAEYKYYNMDQVIGSVIEKLNRF